MLNTSIPTHPIVATETRVTQSQSPVKVVNNSGSIESGLHSLHSNQKSMDQTSPVNPLNGHSKISNKHLGV